MANETLTSEGRQAHHCHAIGCEKRVPPKMFMCLPHWKRLPKQHQQAIWRTYRPGQENEKNPSLAYLQAQTKAVLVMATIDRRSAEELERQRKLVDWVESKVAASWKSVFEDKCAN